MRLSLFLAGAIALASLAAGLGFGWLRSQPIDEIDFMDVGQGDCTVIRSQGAALLVDVGPASPTFDAGKLIVVPKLRQWGVDSVSLILLTHPDQDHVGGLPALMNRFPSAKVAISDQFRDNPKMLHVLTEAGVSPLDVIWLSKKQPGRLGDFTLTFDCPPYNNAEPDNDGCVFLKVSDGQASAVLTADAPSEIEDEMLPDADWSAQILKVGHHGSKFSCGEEWLRAVRPEFGVISCGQGNTYGDPSPLIEQRLAESNVREFRTDRQGDIRFAVTKGRFAREP